jgi:hypothetical protein
MSFYGRVRKFFGLSNKKEITSKEINAAIRIKLSKNEDSDLPLPAWLLYPVMRFEELPLTYKIISSIIVIPAIIWVLAPLKNFLFRTGYGETYKSNLKPKVSLHLRKDDQGQANDDLYTKRINQQADDNTKKVKADNIADIKGRLDNALMKIKITLQDKKLVDTQSKIKGSNCNFRQTFNPESGENTKETNNAREKLISSMESDDSLGNTRILLRLIANKLNEGKSGKEFRYKSIETSLKTFEEANPDKSPNRFSPG